METTNKNSVQNKNEKWINTIIFFVATIFFYFIISFVMNKFVYPPVEFDIQENTQINSQQYESTWDSIQNLDLEEIFLYDETESTYHNSADDYHAKTEYMCGEFDYFCNKMNVDENYDAKDNYFYSALSVKSLDFIDQNLEYWHSMRNTIEAFNINKEQWPRRGQSTRYKTSMYTETMENYWEYFYVASHELWHIVDLWALRWNTNTRDENFTEFGKVIFREDDPSIDYYKISWISEDTRKNDSTKKDFCSGYGLYNPFEDFAECFNLYINFNDSFKYLASKNDIMQQKYDFIATLFDSTYLYDNELVLEKFQANKNRRPWDTTRI